jgi:hypothetical protein
MCAGNHVMVPHCILHFDKKVFLASRSTTGVLSAGSKLGAVGSSQVVHREGHLAEERQVSGRFLTKCFVITFVATLLHRFSIEAVGNPPIPEPDVGRPVLCIISIKKGQDYIVSISKQKNEGNIRRAVHYTSSTNGNLEVREHRGVVTPRFEAVYLGRKSEFYGSLTGFSPYAALLMHNRKQFNCTPIMALIRFRKLTRPVI